VPPLVSTPFSLLTEWLEQLPQPPEASPPSAEVINTPASIRG
jgi:hypothetical protein